MEWRDHISSDPAVLGGKPAIRGTRLSVAFLRSLLDNGWTEKEIMDSYPQVSQEALRAVLRT